MCIARKSEGEENAASRILFARIDEVGFLRARMQRFIYPRTAATMITVKTTTKINSKQHALPLALF